ncbi:hypothetical protein NC651_036057 [Populus alba x Populus x berolinensis]|nr:hypothetical protein NC651_036057 [Populus alba x Populus x berolinensis]
MTILELEQRKATQAMEHQVAATEKSHKRYRKPEKACLYSFETDISRSDMILVLYIKKKTSIRYGHKSVANEKLVTLLS